MNKITDGNNAGGFPLVLQKTSDDVPLEALSNPALLFLYYRIEQIFGVRAGYEALKNLNSFIEETCGFTFIENPAAYEYLLTSREEIFNIPKYFTVSETYFFRESVHFKVLEELLPELSKSGHPINICSAACSIGCEPYSIAMLLDYHLEKGAQFDFSIDAFDINNEAVETAKNARYSSNVLRNDGIIWNHLVDKYLTQCGGEFVVSQDIKKKINFFPHNIMRGLEKQYDIIFFRNALIYFNSKNKYNVLNNLSSSLVSGGYLFLGISETSSVNHPLLVNCYSSDAFYFQKTNTVNNAQPVCPVKKTEIHFKSAEITGSKEKNRKNKVNVQHNPKINNISRHAQSQPAVNCVEISGILEIEEGKTNALNVLEAISNKNAASLSGGELAASVIYYLNAHDLSSAGAVLLYLEEHDTGAITNFLRGEIFYHNGNNEEAEKYYNEAAVKDRTFWPAFYRITVLASAGNQDRYEHKIKKTIESIKLSQDHENNYECFLGGFSRDYFLRILEKKLS